MPDDVPALLRRLLTEDPARPRVTWYGSGAERVELSGKWLDNWVAKTANLLVEEFDAGPDTTVALDLPVHWRTAVWALAAWSVGATVVAASDGPAVLVTTSPADAATTAATAGPTVEVVAVALPALAPSFGADLPDGVLDGNAQTRVRGDVFVPLVPADNADLVAAAASVAARRGWPPSVRLLVPGAGGADGADGADGEDHDPVAWLLAPLAVGGSVVLVDAGTAEPDVERLASQEAVTARW